MRVVMIVPTGIGCSIGGHSGDANPAAQLMAAACDELIVHPNVVNASDINEMAENTLYVDGHALDIFLQGRIALRKSRANRVLVLTNAPALVETRNAVGAARATLGLEAWVEELETPLRMRAELMPDGSAGGNYSGVEELVDQVKRHDGPRPYDAVAISSPIDVNREVAEHYLRTGRGINPWGGIEAMVSRAISARLGVPVAHAPIDGVIGEWDEVVDDRLAAEVVSVAYLHCVLKGLRRAPAFLPIEVARASDLTVHDVDMLISPTDCWGPPHEACQVAGVEVVWVNDNKPVVRCSHHGKVTRMLSYLEAAGLVSARRAGVSVRSTR